MDTHQDQNKEGATASHSVEKRTEPVQFQMPFNNLMAGATGTFVIEKRRHSVFFGNGEVFIGEKERIESLSKNHELGSFFLDPGRWEITPLQGLLSELRLFMPEDVVYVFTEERREADQPSDSN